MRLTIASPWASSFSQATPHPPSFVGHPLPAERAGVESTSDTGPLRWGEGGDPAVAGEPGEGSFPFQ